MTDPTDSLEMKVLSELNSRTLVNGAPIDPDLISQALGISSDDLRIVLSKLEPRGLIRSDSNRLIGLTAAGHEHLSG